MFALPQEVSFDTSGTLDSTSEFMHGLGPLVAVVSIAAAAGLILVNFLFALAIGADALRRLEAKKPLAFVGPGTWFLATWVGSFVTIALYWVMHYSSLRRDGEFPS
ncbi:MAG: hypothetical protein EXS08_14720 [Planctomycetes bacterium]|nr:hypothetical protein [Planctomycetota bacterium]